MRWSKSKLAMPVEASASMTMHVAASRLRVVTPMREKLFHLHEDLVGEWSGPWRGGRR